MKRLLPAAAVCVYLAVVLIIGGPGGWKALGVPGESPSFLDLRSVTSAWVCTREHRAVLPQNPCDPQQRPANYPRVWLLPSHLGWGQSATVPLGILIGVLFFVAALSLVPADASWWRAGAYGAFLCTPGMMLGVERGNVDLLLFCLVVLAVWLLARTASAALILAAAVLKLFPVFAAPVLLRLPRRRAIVSICLLGAAFGGYVVATLGTIRAILKAVPKSGSWSYGVDIFGHPLSRAAPVGGRYIWDAILVAIAVGCAVLIERRLRRIDPVPPQIPRFEVDAFVAGLSVFALSYVFFRNFDYRLSFLLLCLPLLLRQAGERRPAAIGALAAMLGTLCFAAREVLPVGVLAQYALFTLLLVVALGVRGTPQRA